MSFQTHSGHRRRVSSPGRVLLVNRSREYWTSGYGSRGETTLSNSIRNAIDADFRTKGGPSPGNFLCVLSVSAVQVYKTAETLRTQRELCYDAVTMKHYSHNRKDQKAMGLTYTTVTLRNIKTGETYTEKFLVDTGATDSLVPANHLRTLGIEPVGTKSYELADGTQEEYVFGLAEISFMDEITAGRVIFGPDGVEPLLGVTVLESAGIVVDPINQTLKKLPAIHLK